MAELTLPVAEYGTRSESARSPLPLRMLYGAVAFGFVIYIPVSFLRTDFPLFLLDLLIFGGVFLTVNADIPGRRILGGSHWVLYFAFVYLFSMLFGLVVDRAVAFDSPIRGLRSLVLGIGVLYLSSVWINTRRRADVFLRIFLVGSVFCVLYGLRQLVFGLLPFELDRLSLMGASAREMDILARIRIPSTFGDPATNSFYMMTAVLLILHERSRSYRSGPSVRAALLAALLLAFAGLGMTLTRSPMLGLAVGLAFLFITSLRPGLSSLLKISGILAFGWVFVTALDHVVTGKLLENTGIAWMGSVHNILTTAWTLIPSILSSDPSADLEKLRTLSANTRSDMWREGLAFLAANPFGGGIGNMREGGNGELNLSPIDVGVLRYGLELGWVGLTAFVCLWLSILGSAVRKILRSGDRGTRSLGRYLVAAWIAFFCASAITSFMHTTVIAIITWAIGGIMLNLDRIDMTGEARE